MRLKAVPFALLVGFSVLGFLVVPSMAHDYAWLSAANYNPRQTIEGRIAPPVGFQRVAVTSNSFAEWLRGLPLMPAGYPVRIYPVSRGALKGRQDVHAAVIDMDVMRFQQCADAIIRLRAEYLWSNGRADDNCFAFTSGDLCCWERWRDGWRPRTVRQGARVVWRITAQASSSRGPFVDYLDKVMEFAGTASLSRQLTPVKPDQIQIGDVFVQGGRPGHAVIVLDLAQNENGKRMMLLGQSYMPAQEFHILNNFQNINSPWYATDFGEQLVTPEWTFERSHCRRFCSNSLR